ALLAHALRGRAGRRPGRDPAPRPARRRRLARAAARDRRPPAGDRVRRRRARPRRAPRPPGRARGERARLPRRGRVRGLGVPGGQGDGRARGALDPQPRRRPGGDLPALLPGRRRVTSFRLAVRLRLPATALTALGMALVVLMVGALFPAVGGSIGKLHLPKGVAELLGGADYGTIAGWMRSEIGA